MMFVVAAAADGRVPTSSRKLGMLNNPTLYSNFTVSEKNVEKKHANLFPEPCFLFVWLKQSVWANLFKQSVSSLNVTFDICHSNTKEKPYTSIAPLY